MRNVAQQRRRHPGRQHHPQCASPPLLALDVVHGVEDGDEAVEGDDEDVPNGEEAQNVKKGPEELPLPVGKRVAQDGLF